MFWRQGIGASCIQSLAKVGAPGLVNFINAVLVEVQLLIILIKQLGSKVSKSPLWFQLIMIFIM